MPRIRGCVGCGIRDETAIKLVHHTFCHFFFFFFKGLVYEHVLGESKFTFVEECKNPQSVTVLLKAPNKHSLVQMKVRRKIVCT